MNIYRTIGGRVNVTGTERVNRDGQMEKLKPDEVEVTIQDRITWYNKAKIDVRGNVPEEVYEVESGNTHGNSMAVDMKHRTMLPRKHQFSTEARLSEQRGEKAQFNKSDSSLDNAVGVMTGAIIPNIPVREVFDNAGKTTTPGKEVKKDNPVGTEVEASSKLKRGSREYKMASAFERLVLARDAEKEKLAASEIVRISDEVGLPIEDVFLLEQVSESNPDLTELYASIRDEKRQRRLMRRRRNVQDNGIPGFQKDPAGLVKVSPDDESNIDQESLNATSLQVGLSE